MPKESNTGLLYDFKTIAAKIAPYAPLLASIIPIPGAPIIAQILSSLGNGKTLPDLAESVSSDSALQEKLKEFELTHQTELQQIGLQYAQLDIQRQQADNADRLNARQREIDRGGDYFMYFLGSSVVIGFFCIAIFVCYVAVSVDVNAQDKDVMMLVVGAALSCFSNVVAYYYGSSKKETDVMTAHKQLINMMQLPNPTVPPPAPIINMMSEDDPPS